jgi:hypothetical protein
MIMASFFHGKEEITGEKSFFHFNTPYNIAAAHAMLQLNA